MKERPILFSAPMVRAILNDTKTQTRRIVTSRSQRYPDVCFMSESDGSEGGWWPYATDDCESPICSDSNERPMDCPYGKAGDGLWVRETWRHREIGEEGHKQSGYAYRATDADGIAERWTPSIHMPRAASRILLEVIGVRVERLQDITEADAAAEGARCADEVTGREVLFPSASKCGSYRLHYQDIWEQINGAGSWDANPWVWVVEFKRV